MRVLKADERGNHFFLNITATDQPGLLYRIARVLSQHKVAVHMARISTLGARAEDFFLVSGSTLAKDELMIEQALLDCVQV